MSDADGRRRAAPRGVVAFALASFGLLLATCVLVAVLPEPDAADGDSESADTSWSESAHVIGEITDEDLIDAIRTGIQNAGFMCPRLGLAQNRGMVARGIEVKAFCGPAGGGTNPETIYRVTIHPETGDARVERAELWD